MYSKECNKLYYDFGEESEYTTKAYNYPIPFSNHSQCVYKDCLEY